MTRQVLNRGTTANDGTGDTLRVAAQKINENFVELYRFLGDDSDVLAGKIQFDSDGIIFEGTSIDDFEIKLAAANATADRVLTLPDADGDFVLTTATQTLTNKTITAPVISSVQIDDTSGDHQYTIGVSELAADRTATLPLLGGNDEFTFNAHTQTLTNKTLTTPTITDPIVSGSIEDGSGNEILELDPATNAINHVRVATAAINLHPAFHADGDQANVNLELHSKGTGAVAIETKMALGVQNVTATPATVSLNAPITYFNMATAVAATMANGTVDGELKHLININSGTATITVSNNDASRDTIVLTNGQSATLAYSTSASEWFVVSSNGATIS